MYVIAEMIGRQFPKMVLFPRVNNFTKAWTVSLHVNPDVTLEGNAYISLRHVCNNKEVDPQGISVINKTNASFW